MNKNIKKYIIYLFEIINSNNFTVQTIHQDFIKYNYKNFKFNEIKLIINNKLILKISPYGEYIIYDTYNKYKLENMKLNDNDIKTIIYNCINSNDGLIIKLKKYNQNEIILKTSMIDFNDSLLEWINN